MNCTEEYVIKMTDSRGIKQRMLFCAPNVLETTTSLLNASILTIQENSNKVIFEQGEMSSLVINI